MKKWKIGRPDAKKVDEFASKCDINKLALEVLSSRGYNDFQQVVDFGAVKIHNAGLRRNVDFPLDKFQILHGSFSRITISVRGFSLSTNTRLPS